MNPISLRLELLDGSIAEVTTQASDVIDWEAHFELSIDNLERATHLYYLAWLALTRLNKVSTEFNVWVKTVKGVKVADPKG